jgi:hypothetical protein
MDFYLNHGVEYKEDISGIIFYFEKTIIFDSSQKNYGWNFVIENHTPDQKRNFKERISEIFHRGLNL